MNNVSIKEIQIEQENQYEIYFSIIESLLFVTGDPLSIENMASILECSTEFTKELVDKLMLKYEKDDNRGIRIIKLDNSYQLSTKPINSEYIQKLLKTNVRQSLSRAALETLAIIAYKQPITRIDVEEIRGVKSDRAIYTLLEKGLIRESGKKDVIGKPNLYATTNEFLKHFGFTSLEELPSIESFIDNNEIDE